MKNLSWLWVPAILCACTQTQDSAVEVERGAKLPTAMAPSGMVVAGASGAPRHSAFASAPDRGSLVDYVRDAGTRHSGAYTWRPVEVSEEHALRAIQSGHMSFMSPDGTPIRLAYDRHIEHPDGNWTWIGTAGDGQSAVITFGDAAAFGTIPQGNGELPLRLTSSDSRGWVVSTDRARLADIDNEATDPTRPDFLVPPKLAAARTAGMQAAGARAQAATSGGKTVIDVLVGYTNGFRVARGSQSAAQTRIRNLVDTTNQAYVTSQINAEIRLVHSMEVNFPDNTSNNDALSKLTGFQAPSTPKDPDPAFSALRAAREQYGADLVSLVRRFNSPENDGCGVAWLLGGGESGITPSDEYFGYSVVSDGTDAGDDGKSYYCRDETFAHELGHNLGSTHDAETADNDPGAYSFSFGYKITSASASFHTIMAYGDEGQMSYPVFSNPAITACGGRACGTSMADNARSINLTSPIIGAFRASVVAPPPGMATRIVSDFNGDGVSDVLWRNTASGANTIWPSAGTDGEIPVTRVANLVWMIPGIGDFNGDGEADLFWRNSKDGRNTIWRSASTTDEQFMPRVANLDWQVVGIGDLDGDGTDDVLWRNLRDGRNTYWPGANTEREQNLTRVANLAWSIVGLGDFDGDGQDDILWRNARDGRNTIWRSGDSNAETAVSARSASWIVAGVGDFDGDGKADILWRDPANGSNAVWPGAQASGAIARNGNAGTQWQVAGAGDYDGDRRADVLWRHAGTGLNTIWLSADPSNQRDVTTVRNTTWVIQK
ncbi:reprolysin-like metallopeptidase [Marilutibacter aestuarii]|uniref:Peptidase M12B domain-containing protein n=1 Tax=Marilutibacter aestuarii TaxID=1706195 RepID=A0A507ZTA4_9GAMM|nr:FG-GAP-like repeat-containing protein [Lysobacter aestuarii]TQD38958.1 hypothetical protein FKV25_15830 [Lysobacter aestuarii]